MLKITENAAKQIQNQAEQSNATGMVLRIAAKTNEDGSFHYGMGFDEAAENDVRSIQHDVEIVVDPQSHELLEEATMDFVEIESGQFNFIFINPLDPNYIPPKRSKS